MALLDILFVAVLLGSTPTALSQATCGLTQSDGINTFTLRSSSPVGDIPLIHMQYDTARMLPISSTVLYDTMNLVQNVERVDNFRNVECSQLASRQQNCSNTMRLSVTQKAKINAEYNSWDRGHLTPVNPMRFSGDAVNATYYCVNIAPQEPWTNRCPWYAVEERTLSRTKTFSSFVMTGLCAANNAIDGNTYYNLQVPNCYWKMSCYIDPATQQTQVVAFISDNTLIANATRDADRLSRTAATTTPRSQADVLNLMGTRTSYIETAWRAAASILTVGRTPSPLPTAESCIAATTPTQATLADWQAFMRLHNPPFDC